MHQKCYNAETILAAFTFLGVWKNRKFVQRLFIAAFDLAMKCTKSDVIFVAV